MPSPTSSAPGLSAAKGRSPPSLTTSAGSGASTTTTQTVKRGRQQGGTSAGANVTKKDCWRLAVDKLQREDSSIADQIAGVQQAAADAGNADFAVQPPYTTQQGRQELESKRWKISTGSGEWVLRDQFDRLVKAVTLFKDVSSAAASIDPLHAGLPLADFCVLMQMATNDSEQYAATVAGAGEIITIVARYPQIEARLRPETVLKQEFERHLICSCQRVLRRRSRGMILCQCLLLDLDHLLQQ